MVAYRTAFRGSGLAAIATALLVTTPAFAQDSSAEESEDVLITAQRENQSQVSRKGSLGALGDKDAMDTPFAIKSYNAALILNQQPQTLGQVLENDPAIRVSGGFGIAAELFIVRGFNLAGEDIAYNGMYGISPRQLVAPELYESVQVLSGASAFLNGAAPGGSGLGGGINLISKRATDRGTTRITANYSGTEHFGGSFDFGRRLGNGDFGVRINGALRGGETAVDGEHRSARVLGGAFDWTTDRLSVTLDIAYQRLFVRGLRHKVGVAGLTAIPRVPRGDVNYAQPWHYYEQRDVFGQFGLKYELADNAEFYASIGARDGMEDGISLNAVALTNPTTGAALSGNAQRTARTDNNESANAGLRVRGAGAGISHELNLGASLSWQIARSAYQRYDTYTTNIYNPVAVAQPGPTAVAAGNFDTPFPVTRLRYHSFYVSDTLGFADDVVLLTVGLRHQIMEYRGYAYPPLGSTTPGAQNNYYKSGVTTPVVGLVIKPSDNISLYANRIEGVLRAERVNDTPDYVNRAEMIPPFQTVQYEIGGKVSIGGVNASIAAYESEKPFGYNVTLSTTPLRIQYLVDGVQKNRGIEFALDGEITPGLRVISGAAVNDARLTRNQSAALNGKKAVGVPDYTVNANVEWDIVPSVTLTGRVMHTGPQMVNQANTLELGSWTRFDVGGRFVTLLGGNPVTFRANVDNVLNKRYWSAAFTAFPGFDSSLLQGLPRTLKLSVTADF